MHLFVIGWNLSQSTREFAQQRLAAWSVHYPALDLQTLWTGEMGTAFLAGVHNSSAWLGPRRYVQLAPDAITLYEGTAVDAFGKIATASADGLAAAWEELPERLEGQYVAVRATQTALSVLVDPVGMEQVYYTQLDGQWLISNSAGLLADIADRRSLDRLGASLLLTWGWVGADRTLREGIRVMPGGEQWSWRTGDDHPRVRTYFSIPGIRRARVNIGDLASGLAGQMKALTDTFSTVAAPLTAGKDSRLVAALLMNTPAKVRYYTSGTPPSQDVEIGMAIARRFDLDHVVIPVSHTDIVQKWEQTTRRVLEQFDGMVSLLHIADVVEQPEADADLSMMLWGMAGEIGRGYWNSPTVLLGRIQPDEYLKRRFAPPAGGLIRQEAANLVASHLEEWMTTTLGRVSDPVDLIDIFYTEERIRRWAGSNSRKSRQITDRFTPFSTRPFVQASFALEPARRMCEPLHFDLLKRLNPQLHSMPLSTPWRPQIPLLNTAMMVKDRVIARLRRQQDPLTQGYRGALLEAKLADIRAACLERSGSPIWDLISRDHFDRLTAATTTREQRASQLRLLFDVATLFEYESFSESLGEGSHSMTAAGSRAG